MPQPFKRRENQTVNLSPGSIMHRPALAIGIAFVATHWAQIEFTLSLAFTVLLGGQEPSAFEAYHELFELGLRHKMFRAAARRRQLPAELITEAEQIHQEARKIATARNIIVHGNWAVCDDRPESLLLSDPANVNRRVDQFFQEFHDKVDDHEANLPALPWSFDFSVDDYVEYTQQDFQDLINRMLALDGRGNAFWTKVANFALSDVRERRQRRRRR
jgi:hypothetical protein